MSTPEKTVGIIGGMGPEATVEFMRRLVAAIPARDDSDHLHVIADNNPKIPSRIAAILEGGGEDPTPVLVAMARKLEAMGADLLTIPCNTAHYYHSAIAQAVGIPVLDMIGLSVARLDTVAPKPRQIGMLASPAVLRVGLFDKRLAEAGYELTPVDPDTEERLLEIIKAVKAGGASPAHLRTYDAIARKLKENGADAFLVACSELSLLPAPDIGCPVIDTLDVLVDATVQAARQG
ncbi:MAG: amino acid racemase [Rhizomicrobium sp.]|jgi:aspartate racemase